MSRLAQLILFCLFGALVTGGLATLYAASEAPGAIGVPLELVPAGVVAALLTIANLFIRFLRWQFGLRRLDVRLRIVDSLSAFVGSFAFLPVPLLLGQLHARWRLLPEPRPKRADVVMAFVWERWLDLWALLALSALALSGGLRVVALALVAAGLVRRIRFAAVDASLALLERAHGLFSPDPFRFDREKLATLLAGPVFAVTGAGSLVAWGLQASGFAVVALGAGTGGGFGALSGAGAAGILGGGLSLVPMGVAVSGLILLDLLASLAAPREAALQAVFAFRVGSVWLSVVLGAVVLGTARVRKRRRRARPHDHFDAIDSCYDSWLPEHYRSHVVGRKLSFMRTHLASLGQAPLGLDLGCGRGWYLEGIRRAGARVIGMDLSQRQLEAARQQVGRELPLCQASLLALPFRSGAYDFAYTINVVHHLPSRRAQQEALDAVARVLRPGGLLFLHEMNVRNPLFRAYLGYVYPILKGIDEGNERFLDPRDLPLPPALELASVDYFTFVPDVCPEALLPMLTAIEARLERSRLSSMSAHFMAVLRRRA